MSSSLMKEAFIFIMWMMRPNFHFIMLFGKLFYLNFYSCGAKKIIEFLGETFGMQTMRRVALTPDARAMTAIDYANISEDKVLQDLVSKVIGDKLLQVKPQSLIDVESRLEQS